MQRLLNLSTLLYVVFFSISCTTLPERSPRPQSWAQPVQAEGVPNLYQVDKRLYRSAQPLRNGMQSLSDFGIATVLNLRYTQTDRHLANAQGLTLLHLPMLANHISPDELRKAVDLIVQADSPVLVHCLHGADRTGAVVAAYRILQQGWSAEAALDELQYGGYGYHYWLFPNLLKSVSVLAGHAGNKGRPTRAVRKVR
ncbi:MAG: phosphatase domain-containing putative toxin [Thiotrichales bacterium]